MHGEAGNSVEKREKIAAIITKLINPPTEQLATLFNTCVEDDPFNSQTIFDLMSMMNE